MRILMPIWHYHPFIGGAERKAHLVARTLVARGHKVTVITGRWDRRHSSREAIDGVVVVRLPEKAGWTFPWTGSGRNIATSFRMGWYVWKHRNEFDAIHGFLILGPTVLSGVGAWLARIPMTVDVGSMGINSDLTKTRKLKLGRLFSWIALRLPWTVVASCEAMRADLMGEGFPSHRITIRPTPVDIPPDDAIVAPGERQREVVVVGRLHHLKGQDVALRAWVQVAPQMPDWTLVLIGDGPMRQALENQARVDGIADRVKFAGWSEDPWLVARHASVCLVPSRIESTSLALLEAQAWGLPVVATKVGGSPEALARGGGILVPSEDPAAIAETLSQLIRNPERAWEMGLRGRAYILQTHDARFVVEDFVTLPPPMRASLGNR